MKTRSFKVILRNEDDMYIALCPEVGTVDQGKTIKQAIAGLKEATRLYLEEFSSPKISPRFETIIVSRSWHSRLKKEYQTGDRGFKKGSAVIRRRIFST